MDIFTQIEEILNEKIISRTSVSGGCIANSQRIETQFGRCFFVKTLENESKIFQNEANGLKELEKANIIRTPKVIFQSDKYLLLENIEEGKMESDFFVKFGFQFAKLHKFISENFGFYEDNFIGSTPQKNIPNNSESKNWTEFYFNK